MKPQRLRRISTIAAAAAVGVLSGVLLRSTLGLGKASKGESEVSGGGADAGVANVPALKMPRLPNRTLAKETEQLKSELELAPRTQRMLWFATRAEKGDPDELRRLVRLAGDDEALKKMLGARWAATAPQHMLDSVAEDVRGGADRPYRLLRSLWVAWAKSDPEALIAALDDGHAFPGVEDTRMTASHYLMLENPKYGLDVLERWNVRHFIPGMEKLVEWARSDPKTVAERVAKMDADHAGVEALAAIGKGWAKNDPEAALEFAAGLGGERQQEFAGDAMEVWAKNDLEAAIAYATAVEDVTLRGMMGRGLLAEWGRHDPAAALEWAQKHLQSRLRAEAIGKLVVSMARKNVRATAAMVAEMDPGGAQLMAVTELVRAWTKNKGKKTIMEAVNWIGSLPDKNMGSRAIDEVYWYFSQNRPDSLIAIVESEHGHLAKGRVLHYAAEHQVRHSPHAALAWAESLPEDRSDNARRAVVGAWFQMQPVQATEWATNLPAGAERDAAIREVVRSSAHRPVELLRQWMEQLDAADRDRLGEQVAHVPGPPEMRRKLEKVLTELQDGSRP